MQVNDFYIKFVGRMGNIETWNFSIVLVHAYTELYGGQVGNKVV